MKKLLLGLALVLASASVMADVYQCEVISQTDDFSSVKAGSSNLDNYKVKTIIQEGYEETILAVVGNKEPLYFSARTPVKSDLNVATSGKLALSRSLEEGKYFYILTQFSKDASVAEEKDLVRVNIFSDCSRVSKDM